MIAKRISIFILAGVIMPAFFAAGAQTAEEIAVKVRVTAEQANIRELPDIGSAMLIQLPEGTVLDAEAREKDWYRVRFTRRDGSVGTGWIHGSLVRPLEPDALPPRKPPIEKRPDIPTKAPPRLVKSKSRTSSAAGKTGLFLFGGGSVLAMGDWNASMKGLADYFGAATGARPSTDPGSMRLAYVLGFEFSFPLTDGLFLGLGADYFKSRSSSEISYKRAETEDLLKIEPHVRALPFKVGLIFSPIPNFYAKGALQVIYAKAGGYKLYATEKTSLFLRKHGLPNTLLHKIQTRREPNIRTLITKGRIDFVLSVPNPEKTIELDGDYRLRRLAVDFSVPLLTNLQVAELFVHSLTTKTFRDLEIRHWDEYRDIEESVGG